jgi:CubicO group peptidase (beta-lactamase class C family)
MTLRPFPIAVVAAAAALSFAAFAADPLPRARPESVGMSSARLGQVGALLKADVDAGRIPGAVIAVARKGRLVYYEAVGWRDKEAKAAMTKDAIFSIASMTKPMTSIAVMQLTEDGRVVITEPVGRYLPPLGNMRVAASLDTPAETVAPARQMTVQDTLRHTSGVLYGGRGTSALHKMYPASSSTSGSTMTGAEFIAKLASLPLAYQPGKVWDYSLSVDIAGLVVESVTGRGLGANLEERIWKPLGMKDTSFTIPAEKLDRYARWFANDPETGKPQYVLDLSKPLKFECGGGCGASTAGDYIRFAQMLLDKGTLGKAHILGKKTVEYMTADHLAADIENRLPVLNSALVNHGFGLGFAVRRTTGVAGMVGSEGEYFWSGAYGTYFWVDPKEEMVVVLMAHVPGAYRGAMRAKVGALVLQAIDK